MKLRTRVAAVAAATAAVSAVAMGGSASAAFPNFSDCPRPAALFCVDVQNTGGSMTIKDTTVPLGDSLEIRGGIGFIDRVGTLGFIPPAGTNGFFARPIRIPGGLLGIDWPIPGNAVTATAQLAGPASSIHLDIATFSIEFPMKLKLDNPILGGNCYIGSNSNPVRLSLTQGTTSPPPPNRPISGHIGDPAHTADYLAWTGNLNVDNSFAVPGASGCGLGVGIVDALVNLKLGLPSAAGNNTIQSVNSLGLKLN
jgi:hypothetical protein